MAETKKASYILSSKYAFVLLVPCFLLFYVNYLWWDGRLVWQLSSNFPRSIIERPALYVYCIGVCMSRWHDVLQGRFLANQLKADCSIQSSFGAQQTHNVPKLYWSHKRPHSIMLCNVSRHFLKFIQEISATVDLHKLIQRNKRTVTC